MYGVGARNGFGETKLDRGHLGRKKYSGLTSILTTYGVANVLTM